MANFRITGGRPLNGGVEISGRKNAALKLVAAALLSDRPVTLHRVPAIADVGVMLEIVRHLGARVDELGSGSYSIDAAGLHRSDIPADLGRKLRASLVLVGPLLARLGSASFPHPGGDLIGKRSIEPHLRAFRDLGAAVERTDTGYRLTADGLRGATVYLKEQSVTGTENLIMAATRAHGVTTIFSAAEEPHIANLCDLLRAMGFSVRGDGSSTVTVEGAPGLATAEAEVTVIPDDIETGTFAVAALVTGGDVTLRGVGGRTGLFPILSKLEDFNARFEYDEEVQTLRLLPSPGLTGSAVQVRPWPGFPPDLQPPFSVLATQAKGTSLIHDWMYDGRLYYVELLQRMGASIVICDPHRALVTGPTPLTSASLITPDIRAGAAFILAALAAEGTSTIEHIEHIERGYADIDGRLRSLGADITREG